MIRTTIKKMNRKKRRAREKQALRDRKEIPIFKKTDMWDFHLGARFFPLGVRDQKIIPYVGGGMGYYEYNEETTKSVEYIGDDEAGDQYRIDKRHDTRAHGYFNYMSIGLYVPLKKNLMLQTEFRRDFDKDHKQYDFS